MFIGLHKSSWNEMYIQTLPSPLITVSYSNTWKHPPPPPPHHHHHHNKHDFKHSYISNWYECFEDNNWIYLISYSSCRNHQVLMEQQLVTRFISLAPFGNTPNEKVNKSVLLCTCHRLIMMHANVLKSHKVSVVIFSKQFSLCQQ